MSGRADMIRGLYRAFAERLGPSGWWPGRTPLEIAVGAILTQNTNWRNVERAIANLDAAGALSVAGLRALPAPRLEELIRPAGYFRIKTARLRNFLAFLEREGVEAVEDLRGRNLYGLREDLLQVRGIGPETADAILCYALDMPVFVVDLYTVRMFARHGLVLPEEADYHEIQDLVQTALPAENRDYNEFHALIVRAAKQWCSKTKPRCAECPARALLPDPERLPS
jgi:endonuclease III related protein